jgi:hypothetical protein
MGIKASSDGVAVIDFLYEGCFCWNIANYVAAIVKEDGCHVKVKEGCWCSIYSPLTLSKKEAIMVGCWWQSTTIV